MSFLDQIFGRKKPTAATAAAALAGLEAELQAIPERIAKAQDALRLVADMTDEEHARTEAELASARRSETRLRAQIEQLRAAHAQAVRTEAAAALRTRAGAVQKRVDSEMPKLIAAYEAKAAEVADIVAAMKAIDDETMAVNEQIRIAVRRDDDVPQTDPVVGAQQRHRSQAAFYEPDQTVTEEVWEEPDTPNDRWVKSNTFKHCDDGTQRPVAIDARLRTVKRIIPGRRRAARSIASPAYEVRLPAARLDGPSFWPRAQ